MSSPDLSAAERAAVQAVLSGPTLSLGPQLERFEAAFAHYIGAAHAVGVHSGTSALHLGVIAAGLHSGDLALTSPFSFVASANCLIYEHAVPIFVDVDEATGNIDPQLVAEAAGDLAHGGALARRLLPPLLRDTPQGQLKALLPIYVYGQPPDLDPLLATAREHGLAVIEDACEAAGSTYKGHRAGTLGDVAAFGFYPNKQFTTAEGGMLVTANGAWAKLCRSLRNQGRDPDDWNAFTNLGYNYRLNELSAALGVAQVGRAAELLAKRARVARLYDERLAGLELVQRFPIAPTTTHMSWFVYAVRILPPACRDTVAAALAVAGIASRVYFTPIHLEKYLQTRLGYAPGAFPVAERLGAISLCLPFSGLMTEAQVDRVCTTLARALDQKGAGLF